PYFDGNNYSHWKAKMTVFIQYLDYNLTSLLTVQICLPTIRNENGDIIAKPRSSCNDEDRESVQMHAKAKHIIICAINSTDFNRVSSCISAKEMWDRLEVTYEGTNQVKEAKISTLVHEYEMFTMKENEDIKSMFTRFTNITNALHSLDKIYSTVKCDEELALITRKFKKLLACKKKFGGKPNKKIHQRGESSKLEEVICFECNKPGHYKSDCPRLKKKEHLKKK
ncbi:LOW QUALITY PROTEIN: zf-CCHC domain-containing protein/UBN2 domain-containing protein, partial [Cephalotus follicularis]